MATLADCGWWMTVVVTIAAAASTGDVRAETGTHGGALCQRGGALPRNIVAGSMLVPVMTSMLEQSPTFRRQCEAVAATPRLRVLMRLDGTMSRNLRLAETRVRRYEAGAIHAVMEIAVAVDYPAVIAHEFEHLLEQIEGADLKTLAGRRGSGVVRTSPGTFETTRAIAAGRTVRREMWKSH